MVVGEGQQGDEHARHAADEADRQVDLAQQQHEDDPMTMVAKAAAWTIRLTKLPAVRKFVLRLEDDRDDDQADDDRQRAEVAGPDAGPPARAYAQALGADGRCGRRARAALDGCRAVALMRSPLPAAGHLGELAGGDRLHDLRLGDVLALVLGRRSGRGAAR